MEKTPLDQLSVTSVCAAAGVSRSLFYQIFVDKYDVVDWVVTELTRPSVRCIGLTIGWREGFVRLHRLLRNFSEFLIRAERSSDVNALKNLAYGHARQDLERALRIRMNVEDIPTLPQFQLEAFALTTTYVTTRWLVGGMDETPEQMADMMVTLVPRELFAALDISCEQSREWSVLTEYEMFGEA